MSDGQERWKRDYDSYSGADKVAAAAHLLASSVCAPHNRPLYLAAHFKLHFISRLRAQTYIRTIY